MQLFYANNIHKGDEFFIFDKTESRHIAKVLRKKQGDRIDLTNGQGQHFVCTILDANDKRTKVSIDKCIEEPKSWDYRLHIAIAPTKLNDRFEWFLEKATEIGIDEITPILCDHSERKVIKVERFEKIIQSAMKQSLKFTLPRLNPLIKFKDFIENNKAEYAAIAHCEDLEKKQFKNQLAKVKDICILIGPEGDFSLREIQMALDHNYDPVGLGTSRLRTETAALVACDTVSILKN